MRTAANGDFKVFTAFWRACRSLPSPGEPLPAPKNLRPPERWPESDKVADWKLLPTAPDWAGGLRATWTPGEATARQRLEHFLDETLPRYREARDLPAETGTSRLSPHLAFGEVSPRQIWHAAMLRGSSAATDKFLSEIGWREFSYSLLFHHGNLAERNFRPEFDAFPWADKEPVIETWRLGRTGYPIVDAAMRQLNQSGYMHNRLRMVVASFLTKDLGLDWRWGERYFAQTLNDFDLAANNGGWQWASSSGCDAQPWFRIFNPVTQSEKFDPQGRFIRRYVPEVSGLPDKVIHAPWTARPVELQAAGVTLGAGYPQPIVSHDLGRQKTLLRYAVVKKPTP